MAKQIAVIMGALNIDNQKKMVEGMAAAAQEADCNLFIFTNYVGPKIDGEEIASACMVMTLPEFEHFDGVVLASNTIYHPLVMENIMGKFASCPKPIVSIDRHFDGMSCVEIYSYDAEYEMVEHFLYHGYTNIAYITGPYENNQEAQLRLLAFEGAMRDNGMPLVKEKIYEGDFSAESGVRAARKMLSKGKLPEAVICANDVMALGAMQVFQEAGYKIPEDIKIAGFDNSEMSRLNNPSLTTVDKNQYEVGYRAIYEIMELLSGKDLETHRISCKLKYRENCGCQKKAETVEELSELLESLKSRYTVQQGDAVRMTEAVRAMTMGFAKTHKLDEFLEVLKNNVGDIGFEKFYLCLCERDKVFVLPERNLGQNIDILQVNNDFTSKMEIGLAYEKGQYKTYDAFDKGMVLPKECREGSGGNTYIIHRLSFQNCCYGYAVCTGVGSVVGGGIYNSMLLEIATGLENVRKWRLLQDAVERLNGMWCYDNLTYLYNRSGFSYEAKTIMDNLRANDKNVFIIFMDADGLKQVNDSLGHEAGDMLIREIGSVVHKNVSGEMLGMRYGGDEFVLFGGFGDKEEYKVERIVETIHEDFREVNASGKYPFKLSASIGFSCWKARDIQSLEGIIEEADQKMYQEKRAKKAAKLAEKKS